MLRPGRPARSAAWLIGAGGLAGVALVLAAAFGLALVHAFAELIT